MWKILSLSLPFAVSVAVAAEARFGFTDPATISFFGAHTRRATVESPGGAVTPAFRANFYPTVKLGSRWFAYGAIQVHSEPYFYEELSSRERGLEVSVLQAYLGYSRVARGRALTMKVGQLTSAFGSFPLRYDDARNWLIDLPQSYGYYYTPVTVYGMPGAEVDVTLGRVDLRAQLTNSSPANPRNLRQSDQYANWTVGGGVTIQQGFRFGVSAYRGPYLHRQHQYFFPGEANPKDLPGTGYGADVQWGRGRVSVNAEVQRFQYAYRAIPYFFNTAAYGEAKVTLSPRWYVAGRTGGRWRTADLGRDQSYEVVLAFRPATAHLMKFGYLAVHGPFSPGTRDNVVGIQYIVSLNPPALTWE